MNFIAGKFPFDFRPIRKSNGSIIKITRMTVLSSTVHFHKYNWEGKREIVRSRSKHRKEVERHHTEQLAWNRGGGREGSQFFSAKKYVHVLELNRASPRLEFANRANKVEAFCSD